MVPSSDLRSVPNPVPEFLTAPEWLQVTEALIRRVPKTIRIRSQDARGPGVYGKLPFAVTPVPWFSAGRICTNESRPARYLDYHTGHYFIQDAGSMLALALLDIQPDERVLDLCAAPGGKATAILEVVGPGNGFLLANETVRGRLPALIRTLGQVGYPRYAWNSQDPADLAGQKQGIFDAVLADAPCSGQTIVSPADYSGAFRRDTIELCAARQLRILESAASLTRPGGRLVYSTCTFSAAENEDVIKKFLETHPDFHVEPVPELTPWLSPLAVGGYRVWPHRHGCAGAYAVRVRRETDQQQRLPAPRKEMRLNAGPETGVVIPGRLSDAVFMSRRNQQFSWPDDIPRECLPDGCGGPEIAYRPGRTWLPSHELAVRRSDDWIPESTRSVSADEAVRFLSGEPLPGGPPCRQVVRFMSNPLGWIKSMKNRANNGLPKAGKVHGPLLTAEVPQD